MLCLLKALKECLSDDASCFIKYCVANGPYEVHNVRAYDVCQLPNSV